MENRTPKNRCNGGAAPDFGKSADKPDALKLIESAITRLLLESGMITTDECDKLSELNRRSFSPMLADLLPKTLEKSSNQS